MSFYYQEESAIKGLKSLSPSETDILITLEYIEKLEKQDEKDFTTIYIKGCVDKEAVWREKIRDKIKKHKELRDFYMFNHQGYSYIIENNIIEEYEEIIGE